MTCLLVTLISKKGQQELIFYIKKGCTTHVETLVVLSHKKPDSHISVTVDFDNTSLDKTAIAKRAVERK